MNRIFLFLLTNVAILAVFSVVLSVLASFGVNLNWHTGGTAIDYQALLIFSAVLGFVGAFVSLALSKWMAKRSTGARVIESPANAEEQWLVDTVARQAKSAGIGMPEVAIFNSPTMNAFATGARRNHSLVAVSSGLLKQMQREEVEAVLAHEVSHVANGDMITLALVQGVINTFVIFLSRIIGHVVDRVLLKNRSGHGIGYWISVMIAQIVLSILASIIVMWFSRRREFRADAGGAKLAGSANMIAALRRLQRGNETEALPEQMAAYGISGNRSGGLKRLFMTHPPLEERIKALENRE